METFLKFLRIRSTLLQAAPLIFFLLILASNGLTEKGTSREIFESRRMQIEFLLQDSTHADSLIFDLLDEADYFARQNMYDLATDLLDQAMELFSSDNNLPSGEFSVTGPPTIANGYGSDWLMSIEASTDYSRSEYEISFTESDSIILEELHQPYSAIRISHSLYSGSRTLNLMNYSRIDETLFQVSFGLSLGSSDNHKNWRIEGHSGFFWLLQELSGNFWENELNLFYARQFQAGNTVYFATRSRYKRYFPDTRSYQNLLDIQTDLSFRHYFHFLHWMELLVNPSIFQENRPEGLKYRQLHLQVNYHALQQYNRYLNLKLNYFLRGFKSEYPAENQYYSFQPVMEIEIPLLSPFGIQGYAEWDIRKYRQTDITYSDFTFGSFNARLKVYLTPVTSFGAGMAYEYQRNRTDYLEQQSLVTQEDYQARGWIVSADILNLNGLMLSITYQQTLRYYPNAGAADFLGIYTNRNIHSLLGFAQIPLSGRLKLEFFANYDSDRDRDRPNNDHLNTIFNFSVRYILF